MRCKTKHLARSFKTTGFQPGVQKSVINADRFFTENRNLKVVITATRLVFRNRNTAV